MSTHDAHGLHHLHKRKNPYPSKQRFKRLMDRLIYGVIVVGPIMTLPQMYKIFAYKNVEGLALSTWTTYLILNLFWLVYAITHKEKPLIFSCLLWFACYTTILMGILLYQ